MFFSPFVRFRDVKPGDVLCCTGFDCINEGDTRIVKNGIEGLCITCAHGYHYLDGQEEKGRLVGLKLVKPAKPPAPFVDENQPFNPLWWLAAGLFAIASIVATGFLLGIGQWLAALAVASLTHIPID